MDHHVLTALPGGQRLPRWRRPPRIRQVAGAVAGYLALREFRARLYRCLTARADALFELADAILCADHAVTSLVQLSLVPEFRRGHGALYDALAAAAVVARPPRHVPIRRLSSTHDQTSLSASSRSR